jgi:MOSC domain-containing protein YiiM
MTATVTAVSRSATHAFSKDTVQAIHLVAGRGVEGDAHAGETVKHRSRVKVDPTQPNLRQVHLIHAELFDELAASGFSVASGQLGENVTTRGIDLLGLPVGTRLRLGDAAIVEVTGLRNPCQQIERFQPGLVKHVLVKHDAGHIVRKTGVMAIVIMGGDVRSGDAIGIELPAGQHRALEPV